MSTRASTTDLPPKPEARAVSARLHRKPVHGSVVLWLMPSQSAPRAARAYLYPASERSPSQARHETESFLAKCRNIPDGFAEIAVAGDWRRDLHEVQKRVRQWK